jgi:uncharacterized protein YchJ
VGNHTIDCEFCGEDQRLYDRCCEAYQQKEKAERDAREAERERLRKLVRSYYPRASFMAGDYSDTMRVSEVEVLIQQVIQSMSGPK